nr:transmembrane protein [Quercus suber]
MVSCNTTLEDAYINETALWGNVTFHHFGLFLAAVFGLISVVISLFLVFQHATHYLKPWEQRHIIRILLMIPIYSTVSFLSYLKYRHAVYFEVLRDCYEAFAIASFFTLLCHYIAPNLHDQKEYFRGMTPINWFWGVFGAQKCTGGEHKGPFRRPRSGLTWFNYCCVRVLFTIVSVISEAFDRYCEASLSPAFAHIWVLAFECVSVSIAMFCLVQFYLQLRRDLAEHRPFLKVLSIKLIIISLLSSSNGPLQPSERIAYSDIKVGIPSVLLCIEMAIFAVMHLFAFPWKEYRIKQNSNMLTAPGSGYSGDTPAKYQGGFLGLYALMDAFNPWDIVKASARGFRWLFVGVKQRHLDPSYQQTPGGKLDDHSTRYTGPAFGGTGDPATELRPSHDESHAGKDAAHDGSPEDDRVGLLGHSARMAGRDASHSPYRIPTTAQPHSTSYPPPPNPYANDEFDAGDEAAFYPSTASHHDLAAGSSDAKSLAPAWDPNDDDPGYHPGIGPSAVHPALRDRQDAEAPAPPAWNHWGGA